MTSSTSHGPLTQAIMGAGASGGLRATPRPCSSTLDRSWTSWAEGWQQVLSLQGHQHPGQMTLLLGRSCISSRGEKHKGEEKGVWFTSLGLELNTPVLEKLEHPLERPLPLPQWANNPIQRAGQHSAHRHWRLSGKGGFKRTGSSIRGAFQSRNAL